MGLSHTDSRGNPQMVDVSAKEVTSRVARAQGVVRLGAVIAEQLADTPNLVAPFCTDERPTNGYAYTLRAEPAVAQALGVPASALTNGIVAALAAEGLKVSRANWLLPAHSVFQAKNAYGGGYPWSAAHTRQDISYDLNQFPVSQACIDSCLWNVNNHRPPNGAQQIDALAAGVRKVFTHLEDVPVATT